MHGKFNCKREVQEVRNQFGWNSRFCSLTQNLTLGPFENATISGLLKGLVKSSLYYKCVNVSVQPLDVHKESEAKYCAVPGYTFLKPGSHRIHIMIKI